MDAFVRKRSLDFRHVLEVLKREELQAACEALGLDTGGREEATLVARILGVDEGEAAEEPALSSKGSSSAPPPPSVRSEGALSLLFGGS